MPTLTCEIPHTLESALQERSKRTGESIARIVATALSRTLKAPMHTLFQVSTSGALVQGIYERAVSTNLLRNYGDFGLGTFDNLDGEMVVLDGNIYRVTGDGKVSKVTGDVGTPFAMVLPFSADQDLTIGDVDSLATLTKTCDAYRDSNNLFYAFRIDGLFSHIHTRAMKATIDGIPLAKAASTQPEFDFKEIDGTLVGIWAPQFSSSLNIAGYHFHFLSQDRTKGGHLLECSGKGLRLRIERLNDFHLSLPETEEFLRADFSKDISKDIAYAEQAHDNKKLP
jgi:acetolactate decarboxylase